MKGMLALRALSQEEGLSDVCLKLGNVRREEGKRKRKTSISFPHHPGHHRLGLRKLAVGPQKDSFLTWLRGWALRIAGVGLVRWSWRRVTWNQPTAAVVGE